MNIKKLSKETINLISAGEVIEGPSDVLKELLENSVDAKSSNISVNIKGSGIDLIEINDDGCGILKEDLTICLEKYTTSKINDVSDLYHINTFGFRGEALSSIDAISVLEIITSTTEDGKGYHLSKNNIKEISRKKGTTIKINDLFYNVPVRKKFLKSKSLEYSKLYNVFLSSVLTNPHITYKFNSEKKNVIFPKTDFENRFLQVFGNEIKSKIIKIDFENEFFSAKGYITNPSNPIYLSSNFLFINNRYVFSPQIYKAITDSYKDYLMIQQKPFFVLFLNFKSDTLDVNVHPKKRVVKLLNETLFLVEFKKKLSNILDDFLGKSLPKTNYNSLKDFVSYDDNFNKSKPVSSNQFISQTPSFSQKNVFNHSQKYFSEKPTFFDEKITLFEHTITNILGQLHKTFIVCETTNGFILIDQHAAAERINLEKNREKYKKFERQNLISKISLDFLSPFQKDLLKKYKNKINELGFSYTLEDKVYYLTTVPIFLNKVFDKNIFVNFLNDLENENNEIYKLKDNLLKLKSCKESLKANQEISIFEQKKIITELNNCSDKGICAHGRPTIIFISLKDIDKLFKRVV